MHARTTTLATALLAVTALVAIPAATASASAGPTPSQVITELNAIGADADNAGTATNQITPDNVTTAGPAANAAWQPLNNDAVSATQTLTGTGQQYSSSDENAIVTAYTDAVAHVQSALTVATGKSGALDQAGQAQPFATTFRALEAAWDSYSLALISADPDVTSQLQTQQNAFDTSVQQAINAFATS